MRYRFSWWDVAVAGLVGSGLLGFGPGPGPGPGPADIIALVVIYVPIRLGDCIWAARTPGQYGFMSNVGGGWAIMAFALGNERRLATWLGLPSGPVLGTVLLASAWIYTGLLLWLTPADRIPRLAGFGTVTPEAHAAISRGLGIGTVVSGVIAAGLGFLPGQLSVLSITGFFLGPIIGLGLGHRARPKNHRG